MCNASNHPPGCECGWGGAYGDNSYGGSFGSYGGRLFTTTYSYTTPNAKCPVCGEVVFFYSSENGSRVFFDALGPPWLKHPCTDNSLQEIKKHNYSFNKNSNNKWKKDGWKPFLFKEYFEDGGKQRINGTILKEDSKVDISLEVKYESNNNWFTYWSSGSPTLIKKVKGSSVISYEISSFIFNKQCNFEEITISLCYLSDAEYYF